MLGAFAFPWMMIVIDFPDLKRIPVEFRAMHYTVYWLAIAVTCLMGFVFLSGKRTPDIMRQGVVILGALSVLLLCVLVMMAVVLRIRPGYIDVAFFGTAPSVALTALMVRYVKKLSLFYRQQ